MAHGANSPDTLPVEQRATLRTVLATKHVASTLVLSLIARLPLGAMALILLLRVAEAHNYTAAGLVDAVFAVAFGISQPLSSRLVDRYGQTRILVPLSLAGGGALALLAMVPDDTPVLGFVVLAALVGAGQPPLGGSMRALWDLMLPSESERHVGYSLDAGTAEIIWTVGPLLLVGVFTARYGAAAGLLLCAATLVVGGLAFAASAPSRRWRSAPRVDGHGVLGPLRTPGVRTLLLVAGCAGAHFNAVQLAVTAFGRANDSTSAVGVLLAIWAAGSIVAGLVLTRFDPPQNPARRLALVMGTMGALGATLGLATSPVAAGVMLFIIGAGVAPYFVTLNVALGTTAPTGMLTEAYGLTASAATVGAALFVPFAGAIAEHAGAAWAMTSAGALPMVAVVVLAAGRGTIAPLDLEHTEAAA